MKKSLFSGWNVTVHSVTSNTLRDAEKKNESIQNGNINEQKKKKLGLNNLKKNCSN